jgi:outer membrane immunogenic protein
MSSAFADGMPSSSKATSFYEPSRPWSGFYLGLHGGGGWSGSDLSFPEANFYSTVPNQGYSSSADGWVFGGHAGYNFQFGSLVFGPEVSYSGMTLKDYQTGGVDPNFPADAYRTRVEDLLTVTGRLGFAINRDWLVYARGGWARAEVSVDALSGPPVPNVGAQWKTHLDGWTAGGGIEYKVGKYGVLGLEYSYVKLDNETVSSKFGPGSIALNMNDTDIQTVQARFSILLNREEAPMESLK